jgi:uncharacterized membrane protein
MDSEIVRALRPEFSMGWDLFLVFVPLVMARWLFRHHARPGPLWWPALILFVLFLPNAPYAFTDLLHLVFKIRKQPYLPVWAVALIVIPEYILYIGAGLQVYTISLMMMSRWLTQRGLAAWRLPITFLMHALCAIGIFLGRSLRLNSWDALRDPSRVWEETIDAFDTPAFLSFAAVTFVVLVVSYEILRFLNQCIYDSRLARPGN